MLRGSLSITSGTTRSASMAAMELGYFFTSERIISSAAIQSFTRMYQSACDFRREASLS
jgi:hypothetical protein